MQEAIAHTKRRLPRRDKFTSPAPASLVLVKQPPQPPPPPKRGWRDDPDAFAAHFAALVGWARRPAVEKTKRSRYKPAVWPRDASCHEAMSTKIGFDVHLKHVAELLHRWNTGVGADHLPKLSAPPFHALGFSVHLCLHQHRDAHHDSSRAARVYQKPYLTIVDWELRDALGGGGDGGAGGGDAERRSADRGSRVVVVPNEWFGNWKSRGLRAKQPKFAGPTAHDIKTVAAAQKAGTMIVYDHEFGGVLELPEGCVAVPLTTIDPTAGEGEGDYLRRQRSKVAERFSKKKGAKTSGAAGSPTRQLALEAVLGSAGGSTEVMMRRMARLAADMLVRNASERLDGAFSAFCEILRPVAEAVTAPGATVGSLMESGMFPLVTPPLELADPAASPRRKSSVSGGGVGFLGGLFGGGGFSKRRSEDAISDSAALRRVSVHLCVSDTAHLGIGGTHDLVVWLTLVDLGHLNPATGIPGAPLTPRRGIDQREVLMLPGDVNVATACRCSDDALAAYEQAPMTEEKDESPQWEGDEDAEVEYEGDYDEDDEGEDEEMGI